jgi:hypothetical protein
MDDKLKNQIVMIVLGALIASSASLTNSFFILNAQTATEKQNIAKAFSLEITSLQDDLKNMDTGFLNETGQNAVFIQETPFYSDQGMYFLLQKDIFLLDDNTSQDLFIFYTNLLAAEQDRKLVFEIQRKGDMRELTTSEKYRQQMLTKNLKQEINNSVTVLPALERELRENSR